MHLGLEKLIDMENPIKETLPVVRFLTKLFVFLMVPGLHLFSIGKRIIGSVFVILFLTTLIVPFSPQLESAWLNYLTAIYPIVTGLIVSIVVLVFIVVDLPNIGRRSISQVGLLVFVLSIALFITVPEPGRNIALSNADHMCPEICYGDVVVFKPSEDSELDIEKIQSGDIVAYRQGEATRVNRVIAEAGQIVCVTKPFQVEVKSEFDPNCDENYKLENRFYFVSGDNPSPSKLGMTYHHKVIHQGDIHGIQPVVVANWSGWVIFLSYFIGV